MMDPIEKALERFCEGFSLTDEERTALEEAERKNAENDEAILHGYSASSREYQYPQIPGIVARFRRGISNLFDQGR
ncbi:hypothetical protein HZA44_03960 [Candidatus Peregrinibacteria bacterium]|nr:hypothetical protein [Candidatus Peregrinibacteria bacterium]